MIKRFCLFSSSLGLLFSLTGVQSRKNDKRKADKTAQASPESEGKRGNTP